MMCLFPRREKRKSVQTAAWREAVHSCHPRPGPTPRQGGRGGADGAARLGVSPLRFPSLGASPLALPGVATHARRREARGKRERKARGLSPGWRCAPAGGKHAEARRCPRPGVSLVRDERYGTREAGEADTQLEKPTRAREPRRGVARAPGSPKVESAV